MTAATITSEAIKDNHDWDIKTDFNCKVLIEQIDH